MRTSLPIVSDETDAPDPVRPRTRDDCINGPRPCPWASCAHSLLIDVNRSTGAVSEIGEVDEMKETCVLDLAERGNVTLEEVGDVYGLSRERIRQVEEMAKAKARKVLSRDLLDGWTNPESKTLEDEGFDFIGPDFVAAVNRAHERIVPAHERGTELLRGRPRGGAK